MKKFKYILILALVLANLVFAQPSFADAPSFTKHPDYIALTKEINNLQTLKESHAAVEGFTTEEIDKKLNELEFQKYAFESGINWAQCSNQTGKTLAVYGPEPNLDEDEYSSGASLYFLADGKTTKNRWDCKGVFLPSDMKAVALNAGGQNQDLNGGVIINVPVGTNLVLKTNADTGAIEFNQAGTKVFKPGEINWFIPNVSQAIVDARVTNAPTNKD